MGETSFPDGQAAEDLFRSAGNIHLPLWYSRAFCPEAIALNAYYNSGQGCLCTFFPVPVVGQSPDQDMRERGRGGDSCSPHVADKVFVHPPTADGMSESMSLANNIAFRQSLQEKGTCITQT